MTTEEKENQKIKNQKYYLKWTYIIFLAILFSGSLSYTYVTTDDVIEDPKLEFNFTNFIGTFYFVGMCAVFMVDPLIESLFSLEESIKILWIQLLFTFIFLFSTHQEPALFRNLAFWWGIISPLSMILRAPIDKIPLFKNTNLVASIGIIATLIGYASSFVEIPIVQMFDVTITITGALLTAISVGYSKPIESKEK